MPPNFLTSPVPGVRVRPVLAVPVMIALRHCALIDKGSKRPSLHGAIRRARRRRMGFLLENGFHGLGGVDTYRIHKMIAARVTTAR
jgi:hypothetical protein